MPYNTKQRETILSCLNENKGKHMTANDIIQTLHNEGKNVGNATVYRYLELLIKENKIRKYVLSEKDGACYQLADDKSCNDHYHFICNLCGNMYHIECEHLKEIGKHISDEHGFVADLSKTVFCGLCASCAGKETNQ